MFHLMKRDVILQKKQLIIFLPFILFFIFMDVPPALTFLVASFFIPFNTYAYDEKAETNILLNSLPYTRKEIIASRYLGAIFFMVIAIGLTSAALFSFGKLFTMMDIALGSGLFLLFAAFTFPLFYILKPGYISTAVIIVFIILSGIGPPIMAYLAEHFSVITDFVMNVSIPILYTGSAVLIMLIYLMSWGLSTAIYQRKVF
ncbi:ABC-2 transporter permease [Bacillus sp. FSL W8-0920]|uniref:ABC-2 transporter permease n=1 Tax=Bacillus TaxID=1386 RepID=UPI001B81B951|nr:ABC-2 transporter permease [Bacillus pumilus]MBR0591388.1 ABC-2 transporter permease [Bacillus pumilus sxm20-2]MDR0120888.1 ABC-2 transporter permease [Bacillus pumilus]MED1528755.1 ABC-2 transporter permease [Bacillus pumilus]